MNYYLIGLVLLWWVSNAICHLSARHALADENQDVLALSIAQIVFLLFAQFFTRNHPITLHMITPNHIGGVFLFNLILWTNYSQSKTSIFLVHLLKGLELVLIAIVTKSVGVWRYIPLVLIGSLMSIDGAGDSFDSRLILAIGLNVLSGVGFTSMISGGRNVDVSFAALISSIVMLLRYGWSGEIPTTNFWVSASAFAIYMVASMEILREIQNKVTFTSLKISKRVFLLMVSSFLSGKAFLVNAVATALVLFGSYRIKTDGRQTQMNKSGFDLFAVGLFVVSFLLYGASRPLPLPLPEIVSNRTIIMTTDWWKPPNTLCGGEECFNLGDEIGPIIIKRVARENNINLIVQRDEQTPQILVVGSVIDHWFRKNNLRHCITFVGPGCKTKKLSHHGRENCHRFLAVRGPLSIDNLKDIGIENPRLPQVVGDPGLLLSQYFHPRDVNPTEYCFIPHISDYTKNQAMVKWLDVPVDENGVPKYFGFKLLDEVLVLDIRTNRTQDFVDSLNRCRMVVSASLHGVIFAESYGKYWTLIQSHTETPFKYNDFAASMGYNIPLKFNPIPTQFPQDVVQGISNWPTKRKLASFRPEKLKEMLVQAIKE